MIEYLCHFWSYPFMRYALGAILLIMPLFSILGTMIVNNGMSFFSDALGHSALTGVAIGLLLGFTNYTPAMVVFAIVFALLMNHIRHAHMSSTDTIIGVFSSCGIALGLVILSRGGGFSQYQSLLIGDILNITGTELILLAITLLVTILLWFFCFNRFHSVSISPALAQSKNISVVLFDNLFVVITAVIVMLSIRWVGLLIINAMLILPAAAARNIASNMRSYHIISLLFGLFSGIVGLFISYMCSVATGPVIVLVAAVLFFGTYLLGKAKN